MESPDILTRISQAPREPGVYIWRDAKRRPLYVGKAAQIKSRLSSYPKTLDSRIRVMMKSAASLEWETTTTDIEALILESQYIKQWRPKYNIVMRDDKQYFFVAVTNEDFPQFILTHQAKSSRIKKPIRELIGPFTDGAPLKATLRALRRLFPYCSCKQQHHVRCLNAHIGKCPGYCCLHPVRERPAKGVASATSGRLFSNGVKSPAPTEQKKEYQRSIRAITDILTGKRDTLVRHLEKEMKAAGTAHQFERALELQRTIERIRRVFENAQINASRQHNAAQHHGALEQLQIEFGLADLPHRIEGYDIANIHGQHATGSMIVFTDGRADPSEYRKFNIKTVRGSNDTAMLREVISRRFTHPEWQFPDVILVDGGKGQLNAIRTALGGLAIPVIALTKNSRHQGDHVFSSLDTHVRYISDLSRPLRDLILHIDSEAHRFAISHYRRRHSKSLVK